VFGSKYPSQVYCSSRCQRAAEKKRWRERQPAPQREPQGDQMAKQANLARVENFAHYDPDWIWQGRIRARGLTQFVTNPTPDREALGLFVAAAASAGLPWPDGAPNAPTKVLLALLPGGTGYQIPVDPTPRLRAMGADMTNIIIEPARSSHPLPHQIETMLNHCPEVRLVVTGPTSANFDAMCRLEQIALILRRVAVLCMTQGFATTANSTTCIRWMTRADLHSDREFLLPYLRRERIATIPLAFTRRDDGGLRWERL
jgi:hypothetical protein